MAKKIVKKKSAASKTTMTKTAKKKAALKAKPVKSKKVVPLKKKLAAPSSTPSPAEEKLRKTVMTALDDAKAEGILCLDVRGQSTLADFLFIASGQSSRHISGIADRVRRALVSIGAKGVRVEGLPQGDWAIVDGGDAIIHLFRPEVRNFYRLEEVWGLEPPLQETFKKL
jgi:ribosome-associated protein